MLLSEASCLGKSARERENLSPRVCYHQFTSSLSPHLLVSSFVSSFHNHVFPSQFLGSPAAHCLLCHQQFWTKKQFKGQGKIWQIWHAKHAPHDVENHLFSIHKNCERSEQFFFKHWYCPKNIKSCKIIKMIEDFQNYQKRSNSTKEYYNHDIKISARFARWDLNVFLPKSDDGNAHVFLYNPLLH